MPKLGYIKVKSKPGKHLLECDYVKTMCTDFLEEYTRDRSIHAGILSSSYPSMSEFIKYNIKPYAEYNTIHKYDRVTKKITQYGNNVYNSYAGGVSAMDANYQWYYQKHLDAINKNYTGGYRNKYIDTLTDDFYEIFGRVDMKFRQDKKDNLYGYGDVIKIPANNIFEKNKEYIFSYFRKFYDKNIVYASTYDSQETYKIDNSLNTGRNMCEVDLDLSETQPYRYDSVFGYVKMLDPNRSFQKSDIKIGYEFTYSDGTKEEFLTNNMSSINSVYGTHVVKFKILKDIVSVHLVVKIGGSFNFGKIFGNLKKLIESGCYPGITNTSIRNAYLNPDTRIAYYYSYGVTSWRPIIDLTCDMGISELCLSEITPFETKRVVANAAYIKMHADSYTAIPTECFIDNKKTNSEVFFIEEFTKTSLENKKINKESAAKNNKDIYIDVAHDTFAAPRDLYNGSSQDYNRYFFATADFIYDKSKHKEIIIDNLYYKYYSIEHWNDTHTYYTSSERGLSFFAYIVHKGSVISVVSFGTVRPDMCFVGTDYNSATFIKKTFDSSVLDQYDGEVLTIIYGATHQMYNAGDTGLKVNFTEGDMISFNVYLTDTNKNVLSEPTVPVKQLERVYEVVPIDNFDDYKDISVVYPEFVAITPTNIAYLKPDGYDTSTVYNYNYDVFVSGNNKDWTLLDSSNSDKYTYSNNLYLRLTTEDLIYKSFNNAIRYEKDYHQEEDPSKHVFDLTFEDGVYKHKGLSETITNRGITLGDMFNTYNDLYYEIVEASVISDMYNKHEWFRLYGIDRESDISKIITFKRNNKSSTILINSVPIEFTKHKLLEYNGSEFVAIYGDLNIVEFGILYSKNMSLTKKNNGLYISDKGVVNFDKNGLLLDSSKDYLLLESSGIHYVPDGYVCSDNYILFNASNKIKKNTDNIVILNKIVIVPTNMKVYIPITKGVHVYENFAKALYYTNVVDNNDNNINLLEVTIKKLSDYIYSTQPEFYKYTYLYPDLKTLVNDDNRLILADIESHLYQSNECQRNFLIEESKYDLILFKNNVFGLDIKMPKILLPFENPKKYKPVLFMNGILLSGYPEVISFGSKEYIIVDLCEVYGKKYEDFDYDYNTCINWYRMNKVTANNEHVFEIELYPEDTKILESINTIFNDSFIPIPLDFIETIKFKGDYCFELYCDGRLQHPSTYKLDIFGRKNDLPNVLNIPVIYFSKTAGALNEIKPGSRITVIKKKDIRLTSYDISNLSSPILHNPRFNKYSKFYYANGRKIPESRMIRLSPNVILFKDLKSDGYTKSFTNYKNFTGSPFIMVSNEMYDLTGNINHSFLASEFLNSIVTSYTHNIWNFYSKAVPANYLANVMEKYGSFLDDNAFDIYVELCRNSLKDNLNVSAYRSSSIWLKVSKYVFKHRLGDTEVLDFSNNSELALQVSFIYSLFLNSLMNVRDISRYSESLYEIDKTDGTRLINKLLEIPVDDTHLINYNYFVKNHLGIESNVTGESLTKQILSNNDSPFFYYKNLIHIPVNYNILPKEWCKRIEPKDTDMPETSKVRPTYTE